MNTDKERLDFWNANSLIEFGYSAKMGGDGAGWYWQLGTNRRSGIKNIRDTLDSVMAQLKKPKQVAQDVAQGSSMRHNTPELSAITFNNANREVLRITHDGRMIKGEGLSTEEATQQAAKLLIASFEEQIQKMVDARVAAMKEASK